MSVAAESTATGNMSAEALKAKHFQLLSERSSLKLQLANLQSLPVEISEVYRGGLDEENDKLARELAGMEERTVMYRSAGWTCFEIDLDVGRRARGTRRDQENDGGNDIDLGLGIRLDTFFRGRYYEPYYLVFARPGQMLEEPQLAGTVVGEPTDADASSSEGLRLIRHTVPHFVPLESLVERYIPAVLGGSTSGGSSSRHVSGAEGGGLSLLSDFQDLPGVEAFLSALHCHLQAYVSRREQVTSLGSAQLPGLRDDATSAAGALEAFGSDAYDLIKVVWNIPGDTATGTSAAGPDAEDRGGAEPAAKRRKEDGRAWQVEDVPQRSVEILVHYTDRRADRLTDVTLQVARPSSPSPAKEDEVAPLEPFEGTERPFGRVRVEMVVAPAPSQRSKRTAGITDADLAALEPERKRREDLERLFVAEQEGEGLELDEALEAVAEQVWREEEKGKRPGRAFVRIPRKRPSAKTEPLPRPIGSGINPDPYSRSPPDFAALARRYPSSLGKHVTFLSHSDTVVASESRTSRDRERATIDFQDGEAVRCLTETLLHHDFGLEVKLHEQRLCPMIPNRLNYILYLRKVLESSLPCWNAIEASRTGRRPETSKGQGFEEMQKEKNLTIRGLDIGTGASAIYPLLGCAIEPGWTFVGTDIDAESLAHARTTLEAPANNRPVVVPASTVGSSRRVEVNHRLRDRVTLLHRIPQDALIPADGDVDARGQGVRFHFTMCNPPFYQSAEDMEASASLKEKKPNAVCHGTTGEMITEGGEVAFVERMVRESLQPGNRQKVLWYTSMLGKLSSVSALVDIIRGAGIDSWAVTKLVQGQTGRWVVSWNLQGLRLPDRLSRLRDLSLDGQLPASTQRTSTLPRIRFASRAAVLKAIRHVLTGLDDCDVTIDQRSSSLDAVAWRQSWTRAARREAARRATAAAAAAKSPSANRSALVADLPEEPAACARFHVEAAMGEQGAAWKIEVQWSAGRSRPAFESFASHVLRKLEDQSQGD